MATAGGAGEDLRKELSCSICLDYFTEAVILKCGHNYCRGCILTHWDETGDDYSGYQCPQCRAVFNKKTFTKNYLVQNLVAKLDDLDLEALGGSSSSSSSSRPARSAKPLQIDGKCEQHGEELKLFCETDGRPICVVCRESRAHRHHEVAPMHEVVHDMKMELQLRLLELNWQKSRCTSVRLEDERTKNDLKLKKQRLKEKIEADVGALVQFLLDERDALLDGLDAEELATTAVLDDNQKTVDAEVAAVDATIGEIRDHVAGKTSFESLVKSYNEAINCKQFNTMESVNCPSDWTDFSGPFQLIVWKKMMHVLHTMPQNLTLDPDTAHPNLLITDFDTQVEEGRACVHEPDLPARFTRFFSVLATASYGGGQHYWEVDVRDKGVWYLGVTAESSNRKGFVSLAPSAGYWSLCLQDRLYANGENGRIPVADYWNSPRVGIYLDYDNGRLCFYDAVTMKKLYMFSTRFEEPVCPFFSPGKNDPGSRLQICHYY